MAVQIRRIVTGHDANGRAVVKIDEVSKNIFSGRPGATACVVWTTESFPVNNIGDADEGRPGATACVVWTSESFPVNNTGDADEGLRKVGTTLKNGTVFRVVEFAPGVAPRNHRTDSIDYAVVLSGEIDMELEDSVVHLNAGDVLVQRGTIHNWVNRGTKPCVIAFILIDAKPVEVGGKVLNAVG